MKRLLIPMLYVALFACRPNGAVHGLYPTGTSIAGFVSSNADGAPINGAAVILTAASQPDRTATTDAAGIFQVSENIVADTVYTVKVTAPGYAGNQITVQTSLGLAAQADVLLSPMEAVLAVAPSTVDFGETTTTSTLMISNAAGQSGALDWEAVSPAAWVTLSPASGHLEPGAQPVPVTLTADRSALGSDYGAHSAFLAISSSSGLQYVAVSVDYADPNAPQLDYGATSLDFGLDTTSLPLAIKNTGTGTLHWSAPTDLPWLSCSPPSGSVAAGQSQTVTITVSRAQLVAASDYDVFIAFASDTVIELAPPVRVHVSTPHVVAWETSPGSIDLGKRLFGSEIILKNTGTDSLEWTASAPVSWLQIVPASGHIGAGSEVHVQVQLDRANVPLGPFSQSVHLHSAASDVTVPISGNRQYVAILQASATVEVKSHGEKQLTTQLFVNNAGEPQSALDWTITTTTPWLHFTPASSTAVGHNLAGNETFCTSAEEGCGQILTATLDLTQIAMAGVSTATATVHSSATGESQQVFFSVDVTPFHWTGENFTVPPALQSTDAGQLVYDPLNDRLLLLTGFGPDNLAPQTWSFHNGVWTQIVTAHQPYGYGQLVFDRRRGVAVYLPYRFGNYGLYEFDGVDWTHPTVSNVGPSSGVFDAKTGKILALEANGTRYDVLTYDGQWRTLNQAGIAGTSALAQGSENAFLVAGPGDTWAALLNVQNGQYPVPIGALVRNSQGDWRPARRPITQPYDSREVDQKSGDLYVLGQNRSGRLAPGVFRIDGATNVTTSYDLPADVEARWGARTVYDFARDRLVFLGGGCVTGGDVCTNPQAALALHAPGAPAQSPPLTVSNAPIAFGTSTTEATLTVTNSGPYVVPFSALTPNGYTATPDWGDVRPNASLTITLTIDRNALGGGAHVSTWNIRSLGQTTAITLSATNP